MALSVCGGKGQWGVHMLLGAGQPESPGPFFSPSPPLYLCSLVVVFDS